MTTEPEATYFGTATFAGRSFELYHAKWKVKRTELRAWYAKIDGQTEEQFHYTRADSPAQAIGFAILNGSENDPLMDKLYGSKGG